MRLETFLPTFLERLYLILPGYRTVCLELILTKSKIHFLDSKDKNLEKETINQNNSTFNEIGKPGPRYALIQNTGIIQLFAKRFSNEPTKKVEWKDGTLLYFCFVIPSL